MLNFAHICWFAIYANEPFWGGTKDSTSHIQTHCLSVPDVCLNIDQHKACMLALMPCVGRWGARASFALSPAHNWLASVRFDYLTHPTPLPVTTYHSPIQNILYSRTEFNYWNPVSTPAFPHSPFYHPPPSFPPAEIGLISPFCR